MCQLGAAVPHGPPPILDIVPFAATACENDIDLELDEVGIDLAAVTPIQEPVGSFAACCTCAAKRPWGRRAAQETHPKRELDAVHCITQRRWA